MAHGPRPPHDSNHERWSGDGSVRFGGGEEGDSAVADCDGRGRGVSRPGWLAGGVPAPG
ncbi:hypothetical protein ANO11243_017500 [Dothideomycetidae sp. 11243]|nr:hypothetical protein ANO11243_017500 [fungal sp. No.11243]